MHKLFLPAVVCLVFGMGYLAGSSSQSQPRTVRAAAQDSERLSDESLIAFKAAELQFNEFGDLLVSDERHRPVTDDQNYFAVSVGGIDAIRDLEEGRGVDPETFAALYAERSLPEIAEHIEIGKDGRLRYKGEVVRMYSRTKLKHVFQQRDTMRTRTSGNSF